MLSGFCLQGVLITVVRPGGVERPEWALLWTAWGRHVRGSPGWALQVAGACYLLQGPLGCPGLLSLVPRCPAWGGWPPGTWGPDRPDVVLEQGLSDAEGCPVVPPPMLPV